MFAAFKGIFFFSFQSFPFLLKESTKIMGLPNWLHWTAWFSKFFMFFLAIMILMTIMQKVPWYGNGVSVVNTIDGTVLLSSMCCMLGVQYVFASCLAHFSNQDQMHHCQWFSYGL